MIRTFPELGIEFAKEGAAVILQTTGASLEGAGGEEATHGATQATPAPAVPVPAL